MITGKKVLEAVGNLGEAGQTALVNLASTIGGQVAQAAGEVCGALADAGEWAAEKVVDIGGAVVDFTGDVVSPKFRKYRRKSLILLESTRL